jgi:O-antigen/teichoic acid export membrane protein
MVLSVPAIGTIFADGYVDAPFYLALLTIAYLYSAFGNLSVGNLINSQGDTKFVLKTNILTVIIGFPLSTLLISQFGVVGLVVTTLIVGLPSFVWSLIFIKRRYGVIVDWVSSVKILFSSALAAVVTYFALSFVSFSNPVELIIGSILFVVVFLLVAIYTRTINEADITNIRTIAGGLGPLRKPLAVLLTVLAKFMPKSKKKPEQPLVI